jgi:hypothetical protein
MRDRTKRQLSSEEARHALYVDFEGRKDASPVLLGASTRHGSERVHQYLTDPRFAAIGELEGIEVLPIAEAVLRIVQRAERKDRLIVAWTEHELQIVERYAPQHLARFRPRYRNAYAVARYWRNACHGGAKPAVGWLAAYLELVAYEVPAAAGRGRAAETIRIVQEAFDRGRTPATLTANQRQRWADLRAHNAHDCAGMRALCVLAASEIDDRARRLARASRLNPSTQLQSEPIV